MKSETLNSPLVPGDLHASSVSSVSETPLVLICAPDFSGSQMLSDDLARLSCRVEQVEISDKLPGIITAKRPNLIILGPWCTREENNRLGNEVFELGNGLGCFIFALYEIGNIRRLYLLDPDDFSTVTEPIEVISYRVKRALESHQKQSELQLLKQAVGHAVNGVVVVDALSEDLPIIYVNPFFEKMTGYSSKETLGRNCRFLQGEERNQPELLSLRAAVKNGEACTVVVKNFKKNGELFWNRLHISPIFSEEGELNYYVGIQNDITAEVVSQQLLRESEERFKTISDSASVMMWMVDRDRKWCFFNQAWLEFFALEEDSAETWMQRVHEEDRLGLENLLDTVFRQPRPFRWDGEVQAGNGHHRSISLSGIPRYDGGGAFLGFVGSATDLTDRKSFERAISRRQRSMAAQGLMHRKLLSKPGGLADLEVLNILTEVVDVSSVSIWRLNKTAKVVNGLSEISTVGNSKRTLNFKLEPSALWSQLQKGESISAEVAELSVYEREFFSGRNTVYVYLAPVLNRGELHAILVLESSALEFKWDPIFTDLVNAAVTAFSLAQAQFEAKEETARLAAFPTLSPSPFLIITQQGECTFQNLAAQKFVRDYGMTGIEKLLPHDYAELVKVCLQIKQTRRAVAVLGKDIRLNWTFVPLCEDETVLAYGDNLSNLAELEQRLVQSQKMEALGQMTYSIGHEFNNLLSSIQGAADLIAIQAKLPKPVEDLIRQISWESEKGAALARHLFIYGKAGSIERRVLDLNELISGMSDILDRVLGTLKRKLDLEHGLPPLIGDQAMIKQVIYNLALNAREAALPDGVLALSTGFVKNHDTLNQLGKANKAGYILLTIADRGIGMSADQISRIFEPLYTTKDTKEHIGMGLFMVYSIIKEHGGWIELTTAPNSGTSFNIYFPVEEKASGVAELADPYADEKVGTILFVEDHVSVARTVSLLLRNHGCVVYVAYDGRQALETWALHKNEIDLVICDVVLDASHNGPELVTKFRAEKPSLQVVLTSGYPREFAIQTFSLPENCRFISKPFTSAELISLIQETLV